MSYTLRQTSELTGLSTKTLRRKIASGEIAADKQMGKYGEEYIIERIPDHLLPADKLTIGHPSGEAVAASPAPSVDKSELSEGNHPAEKPEQCKPEKQSSSEINIEKEKQEIAEAKSESNGGNPATSTGQRDGQPHPQSLDMNTTLHELLKLVRKLQEENAALHEKIGELNATVQLLSSGRMLPMSMPLVSPAERKNWWQKLAFWRG